MFELSPTSSHTGVQLFTLLVDCLANDMLLQTRSRTNQTAKFDEKLI